MKSDGIVADINLETFLKCIGGPIEAVLQKNEKSHEVKASSDINSNALEKNDESSFRNQELSQSNQTRRVNCI